MASLSGQIAIITGGARGIGRAVALRLANDGANLVIGDLDSAGAEAVASEVRMLGSEALPFALDVKKTESVESMVAQAYNHWGRIDILVNNAGVTIPDNVLDGSESDWNTMVEINLKGVFRCSQAVGRIMVKQRSGRIINIASEAGKIGRPLFSVYSATKFGVVGFTQGLAQELASFGITVNAVCPGIVNTEMWTELDRYLTEREGGKPGDALNRRRKSIPLGRLAEPEDIAGVVGFLASSDSAYMTGQSLNVTGGRIFH